MSQQEYDTFTPAQIQHVRFVWLDREERAYRRAGFVSEAEESEESEESKKQYMRPAALQAKMRLYSEIPETK